MSCLDVIDRKEAELELAGPDERQRRDEFYGIRRELLDQVGPSVVSINGIIASIAVTEFVVAVTGIRRPNRLLTLLRPHRQGHCVGQRPARRLLLL